MAETRVAAIVGVGPGLGTALARRFGPAKFALRGLAQVMAHDLGPQGIHVAYVNIDGAIDTPVPLSPHAVHTLEISTSHTVVFDTRDDSPVASVKFSNSLYGQTSVRLFRVPDPFHLRLVSGCLRRLSSRPRACA